MTDLTRAARENGKTKRWAPAVVAMLAILVLGGSTTALFVLEACGDTTPAGPAGSASGSAATTTTPPSPPSPTNNPPPPT